MKLKNVAAACFTLGLAGGMVIPTASAASAESSYQDSNSIYTRQVSDTQASVGQTITYSQTFSTTTASSKDYIYSWSNNVDTCLEYVAGSATLNGETIADSQVMHTPGKTTINAPSNYWTFSQAAPHAFRMSYQIAPSCAGKTLASGFWYKYGSWFDSKTYDSTLFEGGPAITVSHNTKAASTTTLSPLPQYLPVGVETQLVAKLNAEDATSTEGFPVVFSAAGETLCTAHTNGSGVATCNWIPETTGDHSIVAHFEGSDQLAASTSEAGTVKVLTALPKQPTDLRFNEETLKDTTQTIISGKATPGALVEALAPGGNRCVATADEHGDFSCNLGYLPAGQERGVAVTESFDGVKSEAATLVADVNEGDTGSFDRFLSFLRKLGFDIQGFFQRLFDPNTWISLGTAS